MLNAINIGQGIDFVKTFLQLSEQSTKRQQVCIGVVIGECTSSDAARIHGVGAFCRGLVVGSVAVNRIGTGQQQGESSASTIVR